MTNIIKCTIKKSVSVTKKLAKWVSIGAGILAGIAVFAYLIWLIREFLEVGYSILASIPWFVWIIIGIPCSIVVYSYLWCYDKQHHGFFTSDVAAGLLFGIVGFIGSGLVGVLVYQMVVSEFLLSVCIFIWVVSSVVGGIFCYFLGYHA